MPDDEEWLYTYSATGVEWHSDGSVWFFQNTGAIQVLVFGY